MRIGFILSTALGNATRYRILRKHVDRIGDIAPVWAPVAHFYSPEERDPVAWLPRPLHTRGVVFAQAWPVLRDLAACDAVIVHQLEIQPVLLALSAMRRRPLIIAAQDNPPMIVEAGYPTAYREYVDKSQWRRRLRRSLDITIAQRTPLHLVWSRWHRDVLTAHCRIDASRIAVAHCGLDLDDWPAPPPRPPLATHALPRILFVGGDFVRKGGPELLKLYRSRLRAIATLDIVTTDSGAVDEPGVTVHRGLTSGDGRLRALFASAAVLALPTKADFSPWVCLEAMASGCPVVAHQVGGIEDLVVAGHTGKTIAPGDTRGFGDALELILCNPALGEEWGRAGRAHLEAQYDASTNVPRMIERVKHAVQTKRLA